MSRSRGSSLNCKASGVGVESHPVSHPTPRADSCVHLQPFLDGWSSSQVLLRTCKGSSQISVQPCNPVFMQHSSGNSLIVNKAFTVSSKLKFDPPLDIYWKIKVSDTAGPDRLVSPRSNLWQVLMKGSKDQICDRVSPFSRNHSIYHLLASAWRLSLLSGIHSSPSPPLCGTPNFLYKTHFKHHLLNESFPAPSPQQIILLFTPLPKSQGLKLWLLSMEYVLWPLAEGHI